MRHTILSLSFLLLSQAHAASVKVYEHSDYKGNVQTYSASMADLGRSGFARNISSIRVDSGRWEFCDRPDFRGNCFRMGRGDSRDNLGDWNDRIQSVKLVDDRDFGHHREPDRSKDSSKGSTAAAAVALAVVGAALLAGSGDDSKPANTAPTRPLADDGWNRPASGWQSGAAELKVYEHSDFRGGTRSYRQDAPNLQLDGISASISALDVLAGQWALCDRPQFEGRCVIVIGPQRIASLGAWNDRIQSFRQALPEDLNYFPVLGRSDIPGASPEPQPPTGWTRPPEHSRPPVYARPAITVYENSYFRGRSRLFTESVSNLDDQGINDAIRSVQIHGGTWELCEHSHFAGECMALRPGDSLDNLGRWNSRASSIRLLE